jgi:5-formyltetrahydrofolate cyclo-ligase
MHASQALASRELKNYQVPIPSIAEIKRALRLHCRTLAVSDPVAASTLIVEKISRLLENHPEWQRIATYFPLPGEPDLRPLATLFPDRTFVYPRIHGDDMTFHLVTQPASQLTTNRWNLREPLAHMPVADLSSIDLMLCPGLAFTAQGHRLGKGKGYYDRYLAPRNKPRPCCIGVTYATHLLDHIPCDPHDVIMDMVITDATSS